MVQGLRLSLVGIRRTHVSFAAKVLRTLLMPWLCSLSNGIQVNARREATQTATDWFQKAPTQTNFWTASNPNISAGVPRVPSKAVLTVCYVFWLANSDVKLRLTVTTMPSSMLRSQCLADRPRFSKHGANKARCAQDRLGKLG